MTWTAEEAGALDALDRILNRGGDPDGVVRAVVSALHQRGIPYVAIRFPDGGAVAAGTPGGQPASVEVGVESGGRPVGTLEVAAGSRAFAERVATLVSAHVALAAGAARPSA